MNRIILLGLIISLIGFSCTDPNIIGLEVQPSSDNIIISETSDIGWQTSQTESEDSLRTDEAGNLILGEIQNPEDLVFGYNSGSFLTQILLTENNTDLGENPIVDSVELSYTYSGYYGQLEEFIDLEVTQINVNIFKDSTYYNNSFDIQILNIDNVDNFFTSDNLEEPFLKVNLNNDFGQQILNLGNESLKDNETFLQYFKGISVLSFATNTMLYLNPDGSNSYFKIYYHNDENDSLSLDFELGGDAARVNLFNNKPLSSLSQVDSEIYIQSMAGYKAKISINNIDSLRGLLEGKAINKVVMNYNVVTDSQNEYDAHEKLFLVRVNGEGENIFLTDYTIEGEAHFGGVLDDGKYEFNITRYFYQLLNNSSYTNELYLLPAGASINANRTILEKDIILTIYYSQL